MESFIYTTIGPIVDFTLSLFYPSTWPCMYVRTNPYSVSFSAFRTGIQYSVRYLSTPYKRILVNLTYNASICRQNVAKKEAKKVWTMVEALRCPNCEKIALPQTVILSCRFWLFAFLLSSRYQSAGPSFAVEYIKGSHPAWVSHFVRNDYHAICWM